MISIPYVVLLICCSLSLVTANSCITTLYYGDVFYAGLSFPNGDASTVTQNYFPYNYETDIELSSGNFTLAPEGHKTAAYVDLGTASDLLLQYNMSDSTSGSPYTSIHFDGDSLQIGLSYDQNTFQPFLPSQLQQLQETASSPTFKPQQYHIYLINISNPSELRIVKMQVVDYENSKATIRWDVLRDIEQNDDCFINANESQSLPVTNNDNIQSLPLPTWIVATTVVLFVLVVILVVVSITLAISVVQIKRSSYVPIK